jgi:arabinofuranosyltransferase
VRIGGDFMAGRFLSAPAFAAAALLAAQGDAVSFHASSSLRRGVLGVALGALAVYGLAWPYSRWGTDSEYGVGEGHFDLVGASGIVDERAYYYPETGLLRVLVNLDEIRRRGLPVPPYRDAITGRDFARSEVEVIVIDQAGFFGYFAGPEKFLIDRWALSDPLLARIRYRPDGRATSPGEFPRATWTR